MSVQTTVRLYQNSKGVGTIAENNPFDTGAFITDDASTSLTWGVFCKRGSNPKSVIELSTVTDTLIGATVKQLDRVPDETGGIYKGSELNSDISFVFAPGKPAAVMRMGYINMPVVGPWTEGTEVASVRVIKEAAAPFGIIGEVSSVAAASQPTPANWADLPAGKVVFADSDQGGVNPIANVFFDFRVPVAL